MGAKVLIVDDDAVLLKVMGQMLAAGGFDPTLAASGEQALALLGGTQFDAALVDKNLEGMDGIEVVRHVRKRQPRCACLVMTGYPSTDSAVEALRLGAADYLQKPSPELDVVAERIKAAIRGEAVSDEEKRLRARIAALEAEVTRLKIGADIQSAETELRSADAAKRRDADLLRDAREVLGQLQLLGAKTAGARAAVEKWIERLSSQP